MKGNHKRAAPIMLIAVVLGVLYWILDALLQAIFKEDVTVVDAIWSPDPAWIARRLIVIVLLIVSAVYLRDRSPKQ